MTIEEFFRFLLRNAVLLIAGIVLGAAAGYGYSYTQPELYQASALGYVSVTAQTDPNGNPVTQASSNMQFQYERAQTYLPLFSTRAVGENIVKKTGLDLDPDAVAGSLTATLDPNAPIITVNATAPTPQEASELANAAVESAAIEAKKLETGGKTNAPAQVNLVNYQTALTPRAPVSPDRKKFLGIGAAIGLLLALGLGWLRDRNDSRIHTVDDVARATDASVLGVLPGAKDLGRAKSGTMLDPKDFRSREALRKLRTNLRFVDVDNPPSSIVVTSSVPAEGKSTVASNLARVIARSGQRTLLIDADMRRPVIGKAFQLDTEVGLSQLLIGSVTADQAIQRVDGTRLWVLPAGQIPPNPSELLGSRRMHDLIAELSTQFFVIVDAPPVLAVTDAQLLSRHTDGAIIVSVPGSTRAEGLRKAVESIRGVGSAVFGVVLNRAKTSRITRLAYGDAEYGYSSYGAYAYGGKKGYGYGVVEPETDAEILPSGTESSGAGPAPILPEAAKDDPAMPQRNAAAHRPTDGAAAGSNAASSGTSAPAATSPAPAASPTGRAHIVPDAATRARPASAFPGATPTSGSSAADDAPSVVRRRRARRAAETPTDEQGPIA